MRDCQDANGEYNEKKEWLVICESVENLEDDDGKVGPLEVYDKQGYFALFVEIKKAYKDESVFNKKK